MKRQVFHGGYPAFEGRIRALGLIFLEILKAFGGKLGASIDEPASFLKILRFPPKSCRSQLPLYAQFGTEALAL